MGTIRGLGRQSLGAACTLGCYYLVAIPLSLLFAFKMEMGIRGLWIAFTVGTIA